MGDKVIFRYKYRDHDGSIKVGRTTGDNPDQAKSKLSRLQIIPLSLWVDGEKEPPMKEGPVPDWLKDAVTPPPESKKDEPVVLTEDEEKQLMEKRELEVKPTFGPPPELLQETADFEKQRAAAAAIPALASQQLIKPDYVTKGQVERVSVRRRQTFLIDDKEKAESRINDLLARKNGKVITITMTPDARGKVLVAAVIEHEE